MRAFEFIAEGNDREFHTGGSLGLPFPGTYEQEYNKFKRKGPRRITAMTNEALDSSYPYEFKNDNYYFTTDDGSEYRVLFGRAGKAAEVAFERRGEGDDHKIGLTGTGDSRKIFGTVIHIVKDYVQKTKPRLLLFTANNSEPSRVKLYKMLASKADQALTDYTYAGALNNGSFTQFNIQHKSNPNISKLDKVKAAGWKTLDKIVGEEIAYHGTVDDAAIARQELKEEVRNEIAENKIKIAVLQEQVKQLQNDK